MDQEKLDKLPQWAQREIKTLEASREGWKKRCEELSSANPDSNVKLGDYIHGDYGLPPNSEVDLYLGQPPYRKFHNVITVQVLRTKDSKRVRISTSGTLAVYPSASNSIELGIE